MKIISYIAKMFLIAKDDCPKLDIDSLLSHDKFSATLLVNSISERNGKVTNTNPIDEGKASLYISSKNSQSTGTGTPSKQTVECGTDSRVCDTAITYDLDCIIQNKSGTKDIELRGTSQIDQYIEKQCFNNQESGSNNDMRSDDLSIIRTCSRNVTCNVNHGTILMILSNPTKEQLPFCQDVKEMKSLFEDRYKWHVVIKEYSNRYDLIKTVIQTHPTIVHIDAHGDVNGNLILHRTGECPQDRCLCNERYQYDLFAPDDFYEMWSCMYDELQKLRLVSLDFCHSTESAAKIKATGWTFPIICSQGESNAGVARRFFLCLYDEILSQNNIEVSNNVFSRAKFEIMKNMKKEDKEFLNQLTIK